MITLVLRHSIENRSAVLISFLGITVIVSLRCCRLEVSSLAVLRSVILVACWTTFWRQNSIDQEGKRRILIPVMSYISTTEDWKPANKLFTFA